MYEGPQTVAAVFIETVTGTNGLIVPPDGYLQGLRELCDKHGILLICDEVMCGLGRTGAWFAVDHWGVVPDMITMAKGLTSAYLPLGAVAMSPAIAEHFRDRVYYGGLTYSAHPMCLAAAVATLRVLHDDDLVGNAQPDGSGDGRAAGRPEGAASVRGRRALVRALRGARAGAGPADEGTHGSVQRHEPGDAGLLGAFLKETGPLRLHQLARPLHQPAPLHQRSAAAGGVRRHRRGAGDHGRGAWPDDAVWCRGAEARGQPARGAPLHRAGGAPALRCGRVADRQPGGRPYLGHQRGRGAGRRPPSASTSST